MTIKKDRTVVIVRRSLADGLLAYLPEVPTDPFGGTCLLLLVRPDGSLLSRATSPAVVEAIATLPVTSAERRAVIAEIGRMGFPSPVALKRPVGAHHRARQRRAGVEFFQAGKGG